MIIVLVSITIISKVSTYSMLRFRINPIYNGSLIPNEIIDYDLDFSRKFSRKFGFIEKITRTIVSRLPKPNSHSKRYHIARYYIDRYFS